MFNAFTVFQDRYTRLIAKAKAEPGAGGELSSAQYLQVWLG
jgi:hypothetical protein